MERELEILKRRCEPLYLQRGFHVWQHALEVENTALWLCGIAREYGIDVDEDLMRAVSYIHDLLYAVEPGYVMVPEGDTWRPAKHREEVHTYIGGRIMSDIGFPSEFIHLACETVPATQAYGPVVTPYQKIIVAADLRKVGYGESSQFITDTHRLHGESEMLKGEPIPFPRFVHGAISYLGLFTAKRNELTPRYYTEDRRSEWHMGALTNLSRLAHSVWPETKVVLDLGESLQCAAAHGTEPVHPSETIHISICREHKRRLKTMENLVSHYRRLDAPCPMTVAIPCEGKVLSVSGQMVDELYLPIGSLWAYIQAGFSPQELRRVLTSKGTLHLYDKETERLPHPPYKEVGNLDAVTNWLAPAGFTQQYDTNRPFGWEVVFSPN